MFKSTCILSSQWVQEYLQHPEGAGLRRGAETSSTPAAVRGWPQHPNTVSVGGPAPSGWSPQPPPDSTEIVIEVGSNDNLQ